MNVEVVENRTYVAIDKSTNNITIERGDKSVIIQTPGIQGALGSQVLSGDTTPDPDLGRFGDLYFNRAEAHIYGPKSQELGWGDPVQLGTAAFEDQFILAGAVDGDVLQFDSASSTWQPTASRYTHVQSAASSSWTVNHGLGARPGGVTVVDSGDNVVVGDVAYVSSNTLTITFTAAFGGKVYVS